MTYNITTPSEYHVALLAQLKLRMPSIAIEGYDEWGAVEVTEPCVLVQWEDSMRGNQRNDGRYQHLFTLTAHCIVPRSLPNAAMVALDLAAEVERLLHHREVFMSNEQSLVHSDQVGMPAVLNNGDTTFLLGLAGMESRGVQWHQPLYLGPSLFEPSEERGGWRLAMNPEHSDSGDEYFSTEQP